MPNKHAAIKDLRKNKKRAAHNDRIKRHIRYLLKKSRDLLKEGKAKESQEISRAFQQAIDKAAKVGVVSKNKAARRKSSLTKAINKKSPR